MQSLSQRFIETLTFPGLRKFLLRYPKASWLEFTNSISKSIFLKNLQKLIPEITMEDLGTRHPSGVRAQAMTPDGNLQMDFEICEEGNQIHVVNAPSPGATASLAIGGHVAERLQAVMA